MKTGYDSIDDAYKDITKFASYARQHLHNRDQAIDAAHDALTKALEYKSKNPRAKISSFIIYKEILRACRRLNKFSVEVPVSNIDLPGIEDEENY